MDIPCTPLQPLPDDTHHYVCGDEQYKWMSDANAALLSQGINVASYSHVICE